MTALLLGAVLLLGSCDKEPTPPVTDTTNAVTDSGEATSESPTEEVTTNPADTEPALLEIIKAGQKRATYRILHDKGINATITNVFAIRLADNKVGAAADVMTLITEAGVGIKYMYSFLLDGKGVLVFRADNDDKAKEVILLNKLDFLGEKDLY
jgi:hypothetical protein